VERKNPRSGPDGGPTEDALSSDDPDAGDVRRVLAGETDAFTGIVRRWQRPLVSLAFRFCRNRSQAEEMAQEAFVRAFKGLAQWRGDARFSTWLFALALNVFRSSLRRAPVDELPLSAARGASAAGDVLAALAARDTDDAVRRAVAGLPARYREAVVVFYFMEQSVSGAAEILGVPEGTVKARLHRGRAMLKQRLSRLLEPQSGGAT
jgi:RNA polymerase sigma-70 factor (ECF subfamily)